jgi:hypothetical protein
VFRGLNARDIMAIASAQPLTAAFALSKINKPEIGGNRFAHDHVLSVDDQNPQPHPRMDEAVHLNGCVQAPAFSTRGTEFVSMYGTSYIDLALLPNDQSERRPSRSCRPATSRT